MLIYGPSLSATSATLEEKKILPARPSALCLFVHSSNAKDEQFDGIVRVVTIEEVPEGESGELQTILVDSGADAAVFPERFATAGIAGQASSLQLHDAQGRSIPDMGMRDLEIHLTDETGRRIVLQEQVAISSFVQQPILCYGRLMQCGWRVSATDQSLVHSTGIKVNAKSVNGCTRCHPCHFRQFCRM